MLFLSESERRRHALGMGKSKNKRFQDGRNQADPWSRQRTEQIDHSAYNLPNVDVHGILFAVVAVVFVVYPLIQWALGR